MVQNFDLHNIFSAAWLLAADINIWQDEILWKILGLHSWIHVLFSCKPPLTKPVVVCVIDPSCCFVSRNLFLPKILLKKEEFVLFELLFDLLCVLQGAAMSSLTLMANISTEQRLMCTVKMTWSTPRGFCVCVCTH